MARTESIWYADLSPSPLRYAMVDPELLYVIPGPTIRDALIVTIFNPLSMANTHVALSDSVLANAYHNCE